MKKIFFVLSVLANAAFAQSPLKLSVDAFENKLNQTPAAQLLDVRTAGEFANGHLKNALNVDFRNEAFRERVAKLDKKQPIFVYCLSGGRSAAAVEVLRESGFTEVYDLQGGFAKWSGANKVFEKSENATPSAAKIWSKADFDQLIAADKPVLIDFFAPWCAPCQKMLPTIEQFKTTYQNRMNIETLNFDDNRALAQQLGIDEIPTLVIYQNSKLLWRGIGFMPTEMLQKAIDEQLAKAK